MVSTGMKCIKYALFAFNLIIVLAGLVLLVTGAVVQAKFSDYLSFFGGGKANAAAIFLMIVGVIVFIIGFFGCCGAVKENHCMIVTFIVLLCIVLVLEIAAAATAFVYQKKLTTIVETGMESATKNYGNPANKGVTKSWDVLQQQFKCCGANNYSDWSDNVELKKTDSVPDSCCFNVSNGCGKGKLQSPTNIYEHGCVKGFVAWVTSNIGIVGGIAAALTVVEIIGIIISGCLASAIRRDYEVV